MNRFFYGFIAFLFLFLSIYPFSNVFANNDLVITGTPIPVQGDITDDQLKDIIVAGITADLVSQGYSIDLSASDGDWDNFKNAILDYIFNSAASGSGFWGEIYNSALYHNLIDENFTIWYPDNSDGSILPGISKRSIYRNLSEGLVNNIIEDHSNDSNPSPYPDPNYLNYINIINNRTPQDLIGGTSFFWSVNFPVNSQDVYGTWYDSNGLIASNTLDFNNYSYITSSNSGVSYFSNNIYHTRPYTYGYDIFDIYINSTTNNQYIVTSSSLNQSLYFIKNGYTYRGIQFRYLDISQSNPNYSWVLQIEAYVRNSLNANISFTGSLDDCFSYLANHVKNVNIYVDGDPWSIVSEQQLPTVIINQGYVLQGTDYPLVYNFTDPPKFDYNAMIDIIKHALLQYGVIQWEDIADVFVDVNGQTAVAILEIHRNDYDVLYDEQYPGIALPNRFNTHLLDSSHQYLSPVVQTVEETTGILPGEIKGALAIGMMLTIFACLIHRLLE